MTNQPMKQGARTFRSVIIAYNAKHEICHKKFSIKMIYILKPATGLCFICIDLIKIIDLVNQTIYFCNAKK